MDDILSRFSINCHSSIRYAGGATVWFDPFRVADAPCDADVVFVTHDHYDHFSPEDIRRVMKPGAVLVLPETCVATALRAGFASAQLLPVRPGEAYTVKDLPFTAVPAYNLGKPFHPRGNRWVGYVVTLEGRRIYVAGDTGFSLYGFTQEAANQYIDAVSALANKVDSNVKVYDLSLIHI